MGCRCSACNPLIKARPEWEEPCKLTPKERILKQRKERYRESQETWAYVQANGSRYEEQREATLAKRKATIEVNSPTIEEMLADPTLDSISPVNIDPVSMMIDDIGAMIEEGGEFVKDPSLAGIASMAVIAIPGKLADDLGGKLIGKYKGENVTLENVDVVNVSYLKRSKEELKVFRKEFNNGVRGKFLLALSNDNKVIQHLKDLGVPDMDIKKLSNGRVPASFEVHHKLPLDDGGTNDFSNLVLIRKAPEHHAFTTYQKQTTKGLSVGENVELQWPLPKGNVYPKK